MHTFCTFNTALCCEKPPGTSTNGSCTESMCKMGQTVQDKRCTEKPKSLTDLDLLLTGVVYCKAKGKSVFIYLSHRKFSPARILQDPKLPDL